MSSLISMLTVEWCILTRARAPQMRGGHRRDMSSQATLAYYKLYITTKRLTHAWKYYAKVVDQLMFRRRLPRI